MPDVQDIQGRGLEVIEMTKNGLLIDYLLCTGCHSCEVSCKVEKNLPTGKFGIKLADDKPWKIDEDIWEYKWLPVPTQLCDLCKDRTDLGKVPICVMQCCSHCMHFGPVDELIKKMDELGRKSVLFTVE